MSPEKNNYLGSCNSDLANSGTVINSFLPPCHQICVIIIPFMSFEIFVEGGSSALLIFTGPSIT